MIFVLFLLIAGAVLFAALPLLSGAGVRALVRKLMP
jgi:hypothetical protein